MRVLRPLLMLLCLMAPQAFADGREGALTQLDYKGQPAGFASQPTEVVNYVENHDNLTLFDLNALRLPAGTSREDLQAHYGHSSLDVTEIYDHFTPLPEISLGLEFGADNDT